MKVRRLSVRAIALLLTLAVLGASLLPTDVHADAQKQKRWNQSAAIQATEAGLFAIWGWWFPPAQLAAAGKATLSGAYWTISAFTDPPLPELLASGGPPTITSVSAGGIDGSTGGVALNGPSITEAPPGVPIVMHGSGFSADPVDNAVTFDGVPAPVMNVPPTGSNAIATMVPLVTPCCSLEDAQLPHAVDLVVTTSGKASGAYSFTVSGLLSGGSLGTLSSRLLDDEGTILDRTASIDCPQTMNLGDIYPEHLSEALVTCGELVDDAAALAPEMEGLLDSASSDVVAMADGVVAAQLSPHSNVLNTLEKQTMPDWADSDSDGVPNFIDPDVASVGGIAEVPDAEGAPSLASGSSGPSVGVLAGVTAGAVGAGFVALGGAMWYVRRRRLR